MCIVRFYNRTAHKIILKYKISINSSQTNKTVRGINKKTAMAPKSLILSHPSRLQMERAYLHGKSIASIAREHSVSEESLRNHLQNNLSRQLVKAYEQKEMNNSMNILGEIDDIIKHANVIFRRNFDKGADLTALKALDSQRSTLELLCKISAYMHQTKLLELQEQQENDRGDESLLLSEKLKVLTTPELEMFLAIQKKIDSFDAKKGIIPERQNPFDKFTSRPKMTRTRASND